MNQFGIGFVLSAVDKASPVIRNIGKELAGARKSAENSMKGMGQAFAAAAIGTGMAGLGSSMVGAAKGLADFAGDFEQKMAGVFAVTQATREEQKLLHDTAIQAAIATQYAPIDAANALQTMGTMGLTANESMKALIPTLDLAAGALGELTLEGAAGAVIGTIKSMGYETDQAASVTDKLLRATQLTNFAAKDFEVSLGRVGSTAKQFGQTLDDGLVTMGLLRNMNVDASVASTGLREAWRRLASDQSSQQAIMSTGVKIFDESTGKIRPAIDVMMDLSDATKDYTDKQRMALINQAFEVRGMLAFNAVQNASVQVMKDGRYETLRGREAIAYLRAEMAKAEGTAAEFRETLLDTYKGQKTLIAGARDAAKTILGEAAAKMFKPIASALYAMWSGLANFMNALPVGARQALLGILTALGGVAASAGTIIALGAAFKFLGISLSGLILSFAKVMLLIGPLTLLIAGLAVGVVALRKAWGLNVGGIASSWAESWRQIKLGFQGVVELFQSGKLSDAMRREMQKSENEGVGRFLKRAGVWIEHLKAWWEGLQAGFTAGAEALLPKIREMSAAFGGIFDSFFGPQGATPAEEMERWRIAGEGAGKSLASLGGVVIDMLTKSAPYLKRFTAWLGSLTAEDITQGINTLVGAFNNMVTVLGAVATVIGVVKRAVMGLAYTFMAIGAAIGEFLSNIYYLLKTIIMALGSGFGVDSSSAADQRGWAMAKEAWGMIGFQQTANLGAKAFNAFGGEDYFQTSDLFGDYSAGGERASKAQDLMNEYNNIKEWVNTPDDMWKGKSGNDISFGEADQAMKEKWLSRMNELADSINRLAKRDLVAKVSIDDVGRSAAKWSEGEWDRDLNEQSVPTR